MIFSTPVSWVWFSKTFTNRDIEKNRDDIFLNLLSISQFHIKKCFLQIDIAEQYIEATRQIEFDVFVDEGMTNHLTLFFSSKKDEKFKAIKKV